MDENAQAGAYLTMILSALLILVGFSLLIVGPSGFLTYTDMGVLLIVIGFIAALLIGVMPSRRSQATKISKCANCGAKIASGYLCSDCQGKLDKL